MRAEFNTCRLLVEELRYLQKDPLLYSYLEFWIRAVDFGILELGSWIVHGDIKRCKEAIYKVEMYLHYVHQLLDYAITGHYDASSDGESDGEWDGDRNSDEAE